VALYFSVSCPADASAFWTLSTAAFLLLYHYATRVQNKIHSIDNQPIIRILDHKKAA